MGIIARGGSSPPSRTTFTLSRVGLRTLWMAALFSFCALSAGCTGPVTIVERAAEAASGGDAAAYEACFTPRSRPILRSLWRAGHPFGVTGDHKIEIGELRLLSPGDDWQPRLLVPVSEGGRTMDVVLHGQALSWRIDLIDTERTLARLGGTF